MTDEIPWDAQARLIEHPAGGASKVLDTGPLREMVKRGAQLPPAEHVSIALIDPDMAETHGTIDNTLLRRYAGLILSGDDHHGG